MKKQYQKPEMKVYILQSRPSLLQHSGELGYNPMSTDSDMNHLL